MSSWNVRRRWAAVVVLVAVAAVVAVVLRPSATRPGPQLVLTGHVAAQDLPGGRQAPLTTRVTVPARPDGVPGFSLVLPGSQPQLARSGDGLLWAKLRPSGSLSVVRFPAQLGRDPVVALERMRGAAGAGADGPVRSTEVAGRAAAVRDLRLGKGWTVREFRFVVAGRLLGVGISFRDGDRVALDTGLAALRTWRWA